MLQETPLSYVKAGKLPKLQAHNNFASSCVELSNASRLLCVLLELRLVLNDA